MPNQLSSISLIFPAYNEEENIPKAIAMGLEAMAKHAHSFEIIVVNDGSTDRTGEVIDQLAQKHSEVSAVHHDVNLGYGAAVRSGISKARCDYVFFTDSDLQFDINELGQFTEWVHEYEIVVGYRAKRADPLHRRINAWGWRMLVRFLFGVSVRDIDCAFKLFQRQVFDRINLSAVGAMINTELLALSSKNGFRIKELPVKHYPRLQGKQTGANLGVIYRAFRELINMYGRLRKQKSSTGGVELGLHRRFN